MRQVHMCIYVCEPLIVARLKYAASFRGSKTVNRIKSYRVLGESGIVDVRNYFVPHSLRSFNMISK